MSKLEILTKRMEQLLKRAQRLGLTEEQKHLDEGLEREYWHYGYAIAVRDILRNFELIERKKHTNIALSYKKIDNLTAFAKEKNKESIITAECPYCGAIIKFRKLGSAPVGKVKIRCQRCKKLFNYSEITL